MKISALLFDLDGTLTLPGALDFPAIKKTMGCPVEEPVLEFIQKRPASEKGVLFEILEREEKAAAESSIPNRGAEECLLYLKSRGYPFGIITRNSIRSVRLSLRSFKNIRVNDFSAVITRDESPPKPDPGGVMRAARQMEVEPERMLLVGDFRFDIIAGKSAGSATALLTNGDDPVVQEGDPEPDYVIKELCEIIELLEGDLSRGSARERAL